MYNINFAQFLLTIGFLFCLINPSSVGAIDLEFDSFESDKKIDSDLFQPLDIIIELSTIKVNKDLITTLYIYGRIHPGYHIYSVINQGEDSPNPTKITVEQEFLVSVSEIKETPPVLIMDESFEKPLRVHKNEFQFEQRFQLSRPQKNGKYQISGFILYQYCTDKICSLPLRKRFKALLNVAQ